MASKQKPRPSASPKILDWVSLIALFPLFVTRWSISFLFSNHKPLRWRQKCALTFLRTQRTTFPAPLLRWLIRRVSTGTTIRDYCSKHNITHRTITLPVSATDIYDEILPPGVLHVLTLQSDEAAAPTLLYFHGGGFVNPLRTPHMPFIVSCGHAARAKQIIILEYSLAPEHPYPSQLIQCVASVSHLMSESSGLGIPSKDIILAGDSAGGTLVGSVLSHMQKPSPYASKLPVVEFRAAVMISPFVRLHKESMDAPGGSYRVNEKRDYLTRRQVDEFGEAWKGDDKEIWANLCGADGAETVWQAVFRGKGGPKLVKKVLITVGTAEVFLDDCRFFGGELHTNSATVIAKQSNNDWLDKLGDGERILVECEGEAHVQPVLDAALGYKEGVMTRAVMTWLNML
ncbi:Alpha/Beta hydrolase protein [Triangularia verruculosa]|uniref:Alpha/Beta hydrolase protein n=1 Tax=Triangularia verruculosa TaxID=2587418 RepID=A0AAN6X7M1_9PEZI|nr:Alpha/Beta hydrolase protein [Triangularia verruculosa]